MPASVSMSLIEQLERIEERMEHSFLKNRFDTFNQLLSERLVLLKQARLLTDSDVVFELARTQTDRWRVKLGKRICQSRQHQMQSQAVGSYDDAPASGRVLNRSL